ncbi:MAG: Cysteine--tRNA ligase [Planctomycetes bacterium]|nr:Cysteine--tRNA ligase [Planctomycetota bacterium]
MTFRLHDSLTRSLRPLDPVEPGVVRMYNCGPTVYGEPHVGNWRSNVCWDVLRRALELSGLRVRQIMNITDVGHLTVDDLADAAGEDKMEVAAKRDRLDAWGVAAKYTALFHEGRRKLNLLDAERYPHATAHVPEMIAHVESLVRSGHAYATPAGNVYFSVASFPGYGKLSGNTVEALDAGARVEVLDEKRAPEDFALWKRDGKHQMQWDSPWGRGFPGWHIECSAMARKYLGDTLDIHTGGEDNAFPHHECEIAQSESLTGKPFSRLWLHTRFLLVDGQKMSKSKGTLYLLRDVEAAGRSMRALRYFLLSTHYRAPLNFTWEALAAAEETVKSLDATVRRLAADPAVADDPALADLLARAGRDFLAALEDDLNVSAALAVVHSVRSELNRRAALSPADFALARERIAAFDRVLGLGLLDAAAPAAPDADAEIQALVDRRESAKRAKDWAEADRIRKDLAARGVRVEDTKQGPKWFRG